MDTEKKKTLHNFLIENFYHDNTLKVNPPPLKVEEKYKDGFVMINLPPHDSLHNNLLLTLIGLYNDLR